MLLKASYEFLFVGKDDNSFLENYSYDLFQDAGENSGQIFINLEIQNNPVDAEEIGAAIFETMQRVFFDDLELDPYERFERSLKAINGVIDDFKADKVSGYIGNLSIIVAAIVGDQLYLSQAGDAEAYLIRKRYVSIVTDGLAEDSEEAGETFSSIASGKIEVSDFLFFSSTRLLRYVSKNDLAQTIRPTSVAETLNEIKDIISTEILGRVSLTGISFKKADIEEIQEAESEIGLVNKGVMQSSGESVSSFTSTLAGKFFTGLSKAKGVKNINLKSVEKSKIWLNLKLLLNKIWKGFFTKGFGKEKIFSLVSVGVLCLFVLFVLFGGLLTNREEIKRLDTILSGVQSKIAEARTKGVYDKESAKEILNKAYSEAMEVLNSKYYRDKASMYLSEIDIARDDLDDVTRINSPKVLADLSEKRSDVNALGFATLSGKVFVYEYNALYELVLDQIQDPLSIDNQEVVIDAVGFEDRGSVVFLTKSGKVLEYKDGNISFMDTDDVTFRKATAIATWGNKIYLLDPANNQIWRYTYFDTRSKFGSADGYFAGDVDLSGVVNFAIDSNIFTLSTAGEILKFFGGEQIKFFINNPPFNNFKDPKVIYTAINLDQVYVLDAKEARVLVYDKDSRTGDLVYRMQYLIEGHGELRDLYVDPDTRKLYILSKSKILEIDLN